MKGFLQFGCGALAVAGMLTTAGPALAGPPLVTDDAGIVESGHLEVELNSSFAYDYERVAGERVRHTVTDGEMKLTTGILKNLGVSLATPYTFDERERVNGALTSAGNGFGDMLFELKYVFFEHDGLALTLKPTILIPTGRYSAGFSEGRWQPGVALIATREFNDGKYALHANLGYEHHDYRTDTAKAENRGDLWSASVAGEAEVIPNLTAMLDFGVSRNSDTTTSTPLVYGLAGFRYEVNKYLDVDFGVKVGLSRPEDDVAALYGVVLKF